MVVREDVEKFASYTTMHGFRRIVASKATPKRIAWIIVFTTAWFFFVINSSILLGRYFKYPKKTTAEIVSGGVPFPAITLCNLGSFDFYTVYKLSKGFKAIDGDKERKKYEEEVERRYKLWVPQSPSYSLSEMEEYEEGLSYLDDIFINAMYRHYDLLNKSNINNTSDFKILYDKLVSRTNLAATMTTQLLSANGVREREFIVKCTFRNEPCKFKKIFDPYFFNCFTFTPPNVTLTSSGDHPPLLEGIDNGFSAILLAGTGMLEENKADDPNFVRLPGIYSGDNPMSGAGGVRVVIHRQGTRPFPMTEGYDVPPERMASLGINLKRQKRLGQPYGHCRNDYGLDGRYQLSAGTYMGRTCEKLCIQKGIHQECRCLENTLPMWSDIMLDDEDTMTFTRKVKDGYWNLRALQDDCIKEKLSVRTNGSSRRLCEQLHRCSGIHEFQKCFKVFSDEPLECDMEIFKKLQDSINCADKVKNSLMANETYLAEYCECYPECDNILYDVSYSLSQWPSRGIDGETVVHEILEELNFTDMFTPEKKRKFYEEYRHRDLSKAMKDFSKINVYVSDADVFQTTEEPAITAPELISNIGGQLGVWIGVSILTLAEVLELLIAMVFHGCRKRFAKHRNKAEEELNDIATGDV